MRLLLCSLLTFTAPLVVAQDQATTLAAACDKAEVVVIATVTAITDPSPEWHRMEWRTDEVLSGQLGAHFTLLEPAGACCGRSLFAIGLGEQRLLFLDRTGVKLHPFGGARGVVTPNPALLAHVRALLAAATPAARAALLTQSLGHPQARVALDAAQGLAALPTLALATGDRGRVAEALELAVRRGSTAAAPLLEVTVRLADPAMLDTALSLYLEEGRDDRARLLRRGLSRVAPEMLTARLPALLGDEPERQLRAAQLLRSIPGPHGESALAMLLARTTCPRVQLCAAEGLLRSGTPARTLRTTVPAPVLELAERRATSARFRSLDLRPR